MREKFWPVWLFLLFILFIPSLTQAETVLRVGSDVSIESSQTVGGDYYVSVGPMGRTDMSGTIEGDALALAGTALFNGMVGGDLFLVAGTGQLHASVTDDARIVAGEVTVAGPIGGDLFVIAGHLNVLSTAQIGGDIYFFGGTANIEGRVGGAVRGRAERANINGVVGGDVDLNVPAGLSLGSQAVIDGDVAYTSARPLTRAPESVVKGAVTERASAQSTNQIETLRPFLTPLLVVLFTALSIFLLFKRGLQQLVDTIIEARVFALTIGAGVTIAAPVVGLILLLTMLGLLLGIALLASFITLTIISMILAGTVAGVLFNQFVRQRSEVTLPLVLIGTTVVYALTLLPVIGPIMIGTLFFLTQGGLIIILYRSVATRFS